MEVVAATGATRLRPDWNTLFAGISGLGPVTTRTRNESVVHERCGPYGPMLGEGEAV
mgnify:CR=1 FL=1